MKSKKFKVLGWLVGIFLASIAIAGVFGFASQRWFEIAMGIYVAIGIIIMFLPTRKWFP